MSDDDYDYNDLVSLKYLVYSQFNAQVTMGLSLSVCHNLITGFYVHSVVSLIKIWFCDRNIIN